MCNQNEIPGIVSNAPPTPLPIIPKVDCAWADKIVSIYEARDIYNSTSEYCANCGDCQK